MVPTEVGCVRSCEFFAHQGRFGVGCGCQARPRRAVAEMPQPWTGLRATQTKTLSREAALSRSCRKRAESVQKMCRIFWLRSLACRLMCGVLTASKMSSTTPGSPGKIPQARRRRARRRAPRKAQKPTQSIRTVGVPNTSKTCRVRTKASIEASFVSRMPRLTAATSRAPDARGEVCRS